MEFHHYFLAESAWANNRLLISSCLVDLATIRVHIIHFVTKIIIVIVRTSTLAPYKYQCYWEWLTQECHMFLHPTWLASITIHLVSHPQQT